MSSSGGSRNPYYRRAFGRMKPDVVREIAISSVRSYMRSMGIDPENATVLEANKALDDLNMLDPKKETLVSRFASYASIYQLKLFDRDWRKYTKQSFRIKLGKQRAALRKFIEECK